MSRQRRVAPRPRMSRRAVPLVVAGMLALAMASASPAAADPSPDLSVSPSKGLPVTGAAITVRGSGFDTSGDVWIAVCQDDGVAPESFAHCLGGAIPNDNATSAWAVVSKDGKPRYAGPVTGKFGKKGDFKVTLQIPVATGQDADCVAEKCAVYSRSADPSDRSQDAHVRVSFSFGGSGTPGGSTPTTEVIGAAPSTVPPDSVRQSTAPAGSGQVVVFSGFKPGEVVDATLYSDPIPLQPVQADPSGKVTISFTVPADLSAGTHLVQAIGRQSDRVGVAQFEVTDAAATTTDTTATTAATETTTSSPAETSDTADALVPSTTASLDSTTTESAATSSAAAAAPSSTAAGGGSSGAARLVWLWVALAAIVVIGGAAAAVVLLRRRQRADGYDGAAPTPPADPVPSWQGVHIPAEPADAPLFSRYSPPVDEGPATEQWTPPAGEGPATEQWTPPGDDGPATEQWAPPFFGDDQASGDQAESRSDPDAPADPADDSSASGRHRSS